MKMKALKPFPYATRQLETGEEFEPESEEHAHLFRTIGHAEDVIEERTKRAYKRRDLTAEE